MSLPCPGTDTGLEHDVGGPVPPVQELDDSSREDYGFIHTESHKQFMDLLLEKRRQLENSVSAKQREKREERQRKEDGRKKVCKVCCRGCGHYCGCQEQTKEL